MLAALDSGMAAFSTTGMGEAVGASMASGGSLAIGLDALSFRPVVLFVCRA